MNREQQIEEIKKVIISVYGRIRTGGEDFLNNRQAEALYNAGYRKLSEDSVVLSREVYDEIKTYQSYIPEMKKAFDKIRNAIIKETAEKIFKMLISELESNKFLYGKRIIMEVDVENLAKQFGVEEKE